MAIKVSNQQKIVRGTTAPYLSVGSDGEQTTEQIRVEYYSLSPAEAKKYRDGLKGKDPYWSEILFPILHALPDLEFEDADGNPGPMTMKGLEGINGLNLQAIVNAIEEDASSPKSNARTSRGG